VQRTPTVNILLTDCPRYQRKPLSRTSPWRFVVNDLRALTCSNLAPPTNASAAYTAAIERVPFAIDLWPLYLRRGRATSVAYCLHGSWAPQEIFLRNRCKLDRSDKRCQRAMLVGCVAQRYNVGLWPANFPVLRSTYS